MLKRLAIQMVLVCGGTAAWADPSEDCDKKDYGRAIADFNKAIEIDPKDAKLYSNRGAAYLEKRDFDGALADFNKAIDLNPKLAAAYYNRGISYENKGDKARALADYRRALSLDPNDQMNKDAVKRLAGSP